jgi:chorismate synthase
VEGCPAGLPLAARDIQAQLDRRRPGQSRLTSARREADRVEILSGVFRGKTLGTPIALLVRNADPRPADYDALRDVYRPSHADYTYEAKYGIRDWRGGGRASARETVARVAAGAVAEKLLARALGCRVVAYVVQIGEIAARRIPRRVTRGLVDRSPVRCPDATASREMEALVEEVRRAGDSVGGIVELRARGVPPGLGEPVFDKLEADLAKAMLSLPAAKGFEVGSGFAGTRLRGSQHNDPFVFREGRVRTRTNRSGGIQGGISNGEEIVLRVAFKPTATVRIPQETVDRRGRRRLLRARGRHDPCVLPRAVPLVEAMAALVLADHWLLHRSCSRI